VNQGKICAVILFTFTLVSVAASRLASAAGTRDEKVLTTVKQLWEQYKAKDSKAFSAILTDDCVAVDGDGRIKTKAQILQGMAEGTLTDYTLTDMKVQWLDKDAVLVHYTATDKGITSDGKPFSEGPIRYTVALVNRSGKWLAVFHQQTAIAAAKQ
jgi:uncharacterized protein (TIGR02246 family)